MSESLKRYYQLASRDLARWIERQGSEVWWNVDGDARLTGRLAFPCPGDELAAELARIDEPLHVLTTDLDADGQTIASEEVDSLVSRLGAHLPFEGGPPAWASNRYLVLRWRGGPDEWLLVEDAETTKSNRQDLVAQPEIR